MIPSVQRYCQVCQARTWWYDGVCKYAYLHPPAPGREKIVEAAYEVILATLAKLEVPEQLTVLSAATEGLLVSIPNWAGEHWIKVMRQHLEKFPSA